LNDLSMYVRYSCGVMSPPRLCLVFSIHLVHPAVLVDTPQANVEVLFR
jgi:hypothetical protein